MRDSLNDSTNQRHQNSPCQIPVSQSLLRHEAVENALPDLRLEGLTPSYEANVLFERYISGELRKESQDVEGQTQAGGSPCRLRICWDQCHLSLAVVGQMMAAGANQAKKRARCSGVGIGHSSGSRRRFLATSL